MTNPQLSHTPFSRLMVTVGGAVLLLAGMRAASPVIGPVVIALLLTIAWNPASNWLQRRGWNPTVAALMGIVLSVVLIALLVLLIATSLSQLQEKLPEYQPRIDAIRRSVEPLLARLPFDASRILSAEPLQPSALVGYALGLIRALTSTAGHLSVLVLLMAFMMLEALRYPGKLRDAMLASGNAEGKERADAFGRSMSRYVSITTIFGLLAGILNTLLLWALGVDFAILWGVLSFLLSFLPNVGFLIALAPPAALALVQFGVVRAAMVVAGFTIINGVLDAVLKPRFVGESLDLSPAFIVLSLVFWGWMLGLAGALLAVPLSIAAKFLFEGFDETRWIAHLMSNAKAAVLVALMLFAAPAMA